MLGAALLLGACGAEDTEEPPADEGDIDTEETDEAAGDATYDAANGEAVYQNQCLACHGGDLEGASGPGLQGYDVDTILAAIEEGPGTMPADLVSGDDAQDVAAWIADQ